MVILAPIAMYSNRVQQIPNVVSRKFLNLRHCLMTHPKKMLQTAYMMGENRGSSVGIST
jgi:hypothetical protein